MKMFFHKICFFYKILLEIIIKGLRVGSLQAFVFVQIKPYYPFAMAVAEKVREMLGQKSLEIREKRVCG